MSLTAAAVRRPVTTVATTIALVLVGTVSLSQLPVSLLPDVSLPVLTVRTTYRGAAAPEVSRFVAEPIEEAVAALPGLVEIRSVSRNGEVTTTAEFLWGTDMQATMLLARERIDNARGRLPESADRPTLLMRDPAERPIAVIALTGSRKLRDMARTAEEVHARRLEQLPGVASVAIAGAPMDEVRVDVDPWRLRALGFTPDDVAKAVQAANPLGGGGTVRRGQFRFAVRAFTELRSAEEILSTPIGDGGPARLRDFATVTRATADPRILTRFDGNPAVGLVVYKDGGANTVATTRAIESAIAALTKDYPEMQMAMVAAQAGFVTAALSNLNQEILVGGLLSFLVILVFLRDWRTSLAIGLMVPLSVLMSLMLLQLMHVTINVFSLGGLALGVGLLVDNAIVVAEAIGRKRDEGSELGPAIVEASDEVAGPLTAGTLTTLLVFGPIIFVRGLGAALFRDLSLSVVASVAASLVLALTLMPVMILGRRVSARAPRPSSASYALLSRRYSRWYERGVGWSLQHKATVFAIAGFTLAASVVATLALPREILPQVDERMIVATLRLPEGTAIEETARHVTRIETAAHALGTRRFYSRVGVATDEEVLAGADPGTSATAQLLLPVPVGRSAADFADALRRYVPDLAEGALALDLAGLSEFGGLIGREGRLVRVELSARDADTRGWADSVARSMRKLSILADVREANAGTQPVVEVQLQRDRLAQHHIDAGAVVSALEGGLGGVTAGDLRETDERTPIVVRFAGNANESLETSLQTLINGIPVGQLVRWKETRAPVEVVRVNQRPVTIVEGLIDHGGTAHATAVVQRALSALAFPSRMTWIVTGADAEQRRTTRELTLVGLLSAALVFLVLSAEFASFRLPLVVMLTVPLSACGGLLLLWATGQSINAVSLIGLVVMIGLADNEAVVKLDAIRRFRAQGYSIEDAILAGGRQRLRAITMTSLTTITGVLPLMLGRGAGGALYQPLAAGVIGGSVSSLLVTFYLLPAAYLALERFTAAPRGVEVGVAAAPNIHRRSVAGD